MDTDRPWDPNAGVHDQSITNLEPTRRSPAEARGGEGLPSMEPRGREGLPGVEPTGGLPAWPL